MIWVFLYYFCSASGGEINSEINQYSLVIPLDIIIHCSCFINEGKKVSISKRDTSEASFIFQKELSWNANALMHLTFDFHPLQSNIYFCMF